MNSSNIKGVCFDLKDLDESIEVVNINQLDSKIQRSLEAANLFFPICRTFISILLHFYNREKGNPIQRH